MGTEFGDLISRYQGMTVAEAAEMMRARGLKPIGGGSDENNDDGDDDDESDDDETDSAKTKKSTDKTFSQAEVDALFTKRLAREKRKLTTSLSESIKEQLKQEMATEKAQADGDLQKVIDDLKPKAARLTDLEKQVGVFEELSALRFEEALEQLPDHIKAFAPDDDAPALDKERWLITKAMPAMKSLKKKGVKTGVDQGDDDETEETPKKRRGMSPFDPDPTGKSNKKTVEEIIKGYESTGGYRPLL